MRGNLIARWPGPHRVSHEDPYRAWLRFHYSDAKEKLCYIALDLDTEIERHLRALTRRRPVSVQTATLSPLAVRPSAAPGYCFSPILLVRRQAESTTPHPGYRYGCLGPCALDVDLKGPPLRQQPAPWLIPKSPPFGDNTLRVCLGAS